MLSTVELWRPSPPTLESSLLLQLQQRLGPALPASPAVERLSLLDWCLEHRPWLKTGLRLDLETHAYLRGLYADECREMVILKAGQMGISEYLLSWLLWNADEHKATGLYVFPTDTHVSDFSAARLGQAIEASPYLADLIVPAFERGADRVGLKRVGDRFMYFRGAKVDPKGRAPQLKSIDADALVLDEYDEMDRRAPAIARERLGHSAWAGVRIASTPTYAGVGIHAEFMATDGREWKVRCAHCGNWQTPELSDLIREYDALERPTVWNGMEGEPYLACRKCQKPLDPTGPGEWVAAHPGREVHGYHVNGLVSPRKHLADIIGGGAGEQAMGLMSTDESKRQQVINQKVGLPYRSTSAVALTDELLDACRRDYALGPRPGGAFCGIDVGRVLNVVIRGADWSQRAAVQLPDFGQQLIDLLVEHGVLATTVDALPETRLARAFQQSLPRGAVWLAYYRDRSKDMPPMEWKPDEMNVTADRTRTLDATFAQFRRAARGEQGATLPANARDIVDYYSHLKAPERKLAKDAKGNSVAIYDEGGRADHYCLAAGTLIQTDGGQVPIEAMQPGTLVATRAGYRRVLAAWQTSANAQVSHYVFSNGASLTATPDHPVYVSGVGFIPLDTVRYGDIMETWQSDNPFGQKRLSTRALSSAAIQTARAARVGFITLLVETIASRASSVCIRRFGKTFTALSRRAATFTTWTKTHLTTIQQTLSAFRRASIGRIISKQRWQPVTRETLPTRWIAFGPSPKPGIKLPKERRSTERTPNIFASFANRPTLAFSAANRSGLSAPSGIQKIGIARKCVRQRTAGRVARIMRRASAWYAGRSTKSTDTRKPRPAPVRAGLSTAVYFVESQPVGNLPVYNLTIEDAHEYFANGILVHNCHAENYAYLAACFWLYAAENREEVVYDPVRIGAW